MKTNLQKRNRVASYALALLSLLGLGACDNVICIKGEGDVEERILNLDPIREVEANGSFKVYLTPGAVQAVQVKGQPNVLNEIRTTVNNGKWKIEYRNCIRRSKEVEVYITLPELKAVYLNGSGSFTSSGKFAATDLVVDINGSGTVDLEVDATKIISKINGSGNLALEGSVNELHQGVTGSGKASLFDLDANEASVTIAGSGVVEVNAANSLIARIDGSGKVYYLGEPSFMSADINGSGKVIKR